MNTLIDDVLPQVVRILQMLETLEGQAYADALEIVISNIRKHQQAYLAELETEQRRERIH